MPNIFINVDSKKTRGYQRTYMIIGGMLNVVGLYSYEPSQHPSKYESRPEEYKCNYRDDS